MQAVLHVLFLGLLFLVASDLNANPVSEGIMEYCESMGDGLSVEDGREMIEQCIEEQSQYYQEDSSYAEEEPESLDCYQRAEETIEQDPNADYDEALQNCFNQHS